MSQVELPTHDAEMGLRDYLAVVRGRKILIFVIIALVASTALGLSLLQTPKYRSTAEVLLQPRASEQILVPDQAVQDTQTIIDTEIQVMRSQSVKAAVRKALGYVPDVDIAARGTTYVVAVSATSPDPDQAARRANTYARTYIEVRQQAQTTDLLSASEQVQTQLAQLDRSTEKLDAAVAEIDEQIDGATGASADALATARRQLLEEQQSERISIATRRDTYLRQLDQLRLSSGLTSSGGAQLVSEAAPAASPFAPATVRNVQVGLVVGLLLGVGLAFLREHLDDSITSREDLERAIPGVDLLAAVPLLPDWRNKATATLASVTTPRSQTAEAYRTLRTSIQFIGIDKPVRVTQVTSANPGEGKSTTLANLGVQLNRTGKRVVMVDCDLRQPRLHQFFDLDNSLGFTSVLLGEAALKDVLVGVSGEPNLALVPSGPIPFNPSELLSGVRTEEVIGSLAELADFVLIDCPPLLPVSDALVLSGVVDATILVVSLGTTSKRGLHQARDLLEQVRAPLVGAVFNSVESGGRYGAYGYTYGYTYGAAPPKPSRLPWRRRSTKPENTKPVVSTRAQRRTPEPTNEHIR